MLTDESKLLTDESKLLTGESKLLTDESKLLTDESKLLTGESKLLTDESKLLTDESKWLTESKLLTQMTRSKIFYSLIESQLLPCTPACGHEFHALTFHPHPRFTIPYVGSTLRIQSEFCDGAFLQKQSMRLGR